MRGSFKKKKAKVDSINLIKSFVVLQNIQRTKKDGTKLTVKLSPNSLQIQTLNLEDKKRLPKSIREKKENAPEKN